MVDPKGEEFEHFLQSMRGAHSWRVLQGAGGKAMSDTRSCGECAQLAEWRHKDGWGALACPGWFTGRCDGPSLGVIFPSTENIRPLMYGEGAVTEYVTWLNERLRELWPVALQK